MYAICSSCRECGVYVVRDADVCLACGSPDPFGRRRRNTWVVLIVLVALIAVAIMGGFITYG